jgi:hypothetical protein
MAAAPGWNGHMSHLTQTPTSFLLCRFFTALTVMVHADQFDAVNVHQLDTVEMHQSMYEMNNHLSSPPLSFIAPRLWTRKCAVPIVGISGGLLPTRTYRTFREDIGEPNAAPFAFLLVARD